MLRRFLRDGLEAEKQDSLRELGATAGVLLRREGYWERGARDIQEVGAYEQAADLLVGVSAQLAADERWSKLANLIDHLPRPIVVLIPELGIVLTAYAETGNLAAGEHRYRVYFSMVETELVEPPSVKIETLFQSLCLDRTGSVGLK